MLVIGLCGGSGSGKGAVSSILSEYGILPIDTDKVYHELTSAKSDCLDALTDEFGAEILDGQGRLDRRKLAAIVFSDTTRLQVLNSIAHFYVLREVRRMITEAQGKYFAVLVDAPLLFESGFHKECDIIVAVSADISVRIDRIMQRDGIDEEAAEKRLSNQISDAELRERSNYIIENNGSLSELRANVESMIKKIKIKFDKF